MLKLCVAIWNLQFLFLKTSSKAFSLFQLRKYGLDLLVTGHAHYQLMYWSPVSRFGDGQGTKHKRQVAQVAGKSQLLSLAPAPPAAAADFEEKLGGLKCFITGGGGGITSENNVEIDNPDDHQCPGCGGLKNR